MSLSFVFVTGHNSLSLGSLCSVSWLLASTIKWWCASIDPTQFFQFSLSPYFFLWFFQWHLGDVLRIFSEYLPFVVSYRWSLSIFLLFSIQHGETSLPSKKYFWHRKMNVWPSSPITCVIKSVYNLSLDNDDFFEENFSRGWICLVWKALTIINLVRQSYTGGSHLPFWDFHIGNNNLGIWNRKTAVGPSRAQ